MSCSTIAVLKCLFRWEVKMCPYAMPTGFCVPAAAGVLEFTFSIFIVFLR